jgi:hypothetical protein
MRSIIATLAVGCTIALAATPAAARGHHRHHVTHKFAHYLSGRHFQHAHAWRQWRYHARQHYRNSYRVARSMLPGPCRVAASMGGPCGCWAAYVLLGRLDHVWHGINLWLANDWLRFPRAEPAAAAAAVWPGRHVAPIVPGSYRNGTVIVRDSWATHRVRTAGLVFVQPPMQHTPRRLIAWPSSVPL